MINSTDFRTGLTIEIDGGVGELNITFRPEITIVRSEKGADFK